jgi:hypothetical protein
MAAKPTHNIHYGDGYDGLTDEQVDKIHRNVDTWPALTPAQRDAIAELFGTSDGAA